MATPDHTPKGRGYDRCGACDAMSSHRPLLFARPVHLCSPARLSAASSLHYFHHANDYWSSVAGNCPVPSGGNQTYGVVDLWQNANGVEGPARGLNNTKNCTQAHQDGCKYEDEIFAEGVLSLIEAHDPSTPLFLFWAPHNIHAPLEVPQAFLDKFAFIHDSQRQYYAAMVNFIDTQIGRVVAALKAKGMWENLLWMVRVVAFLSLFLPSARRPLFPTWLLRLHPTLPPAQSSSDNGGPIYNSGNAGANNFPLRGGKMSNWQGGIRVNAYASGGFLPAAVRGTTAQGLIETADMYTTFCAIAGVDATDGRAAAAGLPAVDGFNMWPMISGANLTSPRTEVPIGANASEVNLQGYFNGTVVQGIVSTAGPAGGLWKLLVGEVPQNIWTGPQYPNQSTSWVDQPERCGIPMVPVVGKGGCLFNLLDDPTEHNDVAAAHPDIVAALYERVEHWQGTVFSPNRGADDGSACRAATQTWGGFYGPFTA